MARIHPTDTPTRRRVIRTDTAAHMIHDLMHTVKFSGTHLARLLLLTPWVLSAAMPALQQLIIMSPSTISTPVPLWDTSTGAELHLATAVVGLVTLLWSQFLEARRRQRVPASAVALNSRWASTLGGCTTTDARSIRAWTRFDCVEAACIYVCAAVGTLLTRFPFTLYFRITCALAWMPALALVLVIIKRVVDSVVHAQGETYPSWVTATANPVLSKALLFEVLLLVMWLHASQYTPYPKPQLDSALRVMLDTGNNSAILCNDEAVFWASFSLPFEWSSNSEPLDCDEPTCGYKSWRGLCEARRLAPLSWAITTTLEYQLYVVPTLLALAISLIGNGRIARGRTGELNLAGLLAPHILLILGLGLCALIVSIGFLAMFFVQAPLLMSGQAPTGPRVCMPSSVCGHLHLAWYLGFAAVCLLPIDTLGRFLKQRSNRNRSYFLSYKQDDQNDGAVQMLYSLLPKCWLDKYAEDRSVEGMVAGVTKSDVFVAIISPKYFCSYFCCLEMHTALSQGKRILVVWNQSKFKEVQEALEWIPPELSMLKSNELLPIQEDIQMAATCVACIAAADVKALNSRYGSIPNSFGTDPKSGGAFSFGSQEEDAGEKGEEIRLAEAAVAEEGNFPFLARTQEGCIHKNLH